MTKSTDRRYLLNLQPVRYSIPDTKGLHLWVKKDLRKYWIFRYTDFNGKRVDMSLGSFPEITLSDARVKAQRLRAQLINGINPSEEKKAKKEALKALAPKVTFQKFAREYVDRMRPSWSNAKHSQQWINTLERYAFPVIGGLGLDLIKTSHIQDILNPIWTKKNETATRLRGRIEKILSAGITCGLRVSPANPAAWRGHLEHVLPRLSTTNQAHHAALPFSEMPAFWAELKALEGMAVLAMKYLILTACRTSEVLYAERCEINGSVWNVPAKRMKAKKPHQVPLCPQALAVIAAAKDLDPDSKYLFSRGGKTLSSMAMLMLLRRIQAKSTVHGFRSTFRDWISEATEHSSEVAEMALAHQISNRVEAAYRRGNLLERRRRLMEDWADYCCSETNDVRTISPVHP